MAFIKVQNKLERKYGGKDEEEDKKSSSTTTTSKKSGSSNFHSLQSEMDEKFSGPEIDENYINTFIRDSQSYLTQTQNDLNNMTWQRATSRSWASGMNGSSAESDLHDRAAQIRSYLNKNKDSFDQEWYTEFSSYLDTFSSSRMDIFNAYRDAEKYYSQWETEEDYNAYLAYQEDYEAKKTFDLDAGGKEVEDLKATLQEAQRLQSQISAAKNTSGQGVNGGVSQYLMASNSAQAQSKLDEILAPYGSMDDLKALVTEKSTYYNQAKRIQEGITLAGVVENDDFEANSGYVSTESDDWWSKLNSEYGLGYGDLIYEYINNQNGIRDEIKQKHRIYDPGDAESTFEEKGYDFLTEDEIAIYNYYYAKDGKEAANKYLDSIQETLNYRKATSMYEEMEGNTALELLFGVQAGLDQFESGIASYFNTRDDYIPQSAYQFASGMVREDLADDGFKLPDWLGGASIGQVGYDAVTTSANMAPSILTSMAVGAFNPTAGAYIGSGLMGVSAAGGAYQEMLNAGYDKDQARAYGNMVGASEAGLQLLLGGISSLSGGSEGIFQSLVGKILPKVDNVIARTAIQIGGNMLDEGLEEGLQEILTPWFKSILTGEDFEIKTEDVLYSSLLGALTAGVMEGPGTISGEANTYAQGKQIQKADYTSRLAEIGNLFSADTVAHQLAGKVSEKTDAYTIGRLFNEIGATMTEQNKADITNALVAEGMTEDIAKKNAEVMAYIVDGGELSDIQLRMIQKNDVLSKVMKEVIIDPNSTVKQRTKGYNEALMALAQEKTGTKVSWAEQAAPGQENASAADMVDAPQENGSESRYEASADGKTILKSTGETVNIKEVATIKDGHMTLKLDDGSTVNARDVSYASQDEALVYETVANMGVNASAANVLVNAYHPGSGVNASAYTLGIKEAYRYGQYSYPVQELVNGPFSSMLTDYQRRTAYKLGQLFGGKQVAKAQATVSFLETVATAEKSSAVGKVHFDGDTSTLTDVQHESLTALETVADVLGVQIHVFESKVDAKGRRIGANGWYDPKDGSIHIDLHAGSNGKGTMLFTAAHELTHFVKQWSPAKFKTFSNFLMKEYGKKGVSVDSLVQAQIAKAKRNGRTISFDTAYEEVIADSMETMLSDGNVMEKLAKLKKQDKSLWQKLKDFISDLAAKIRKVYEGLTPDSVEGRYVAEMKDAIEELQEMFTEALVEASENYQASLTPGEEGTVFNQNGDPVAHATPDGTVQLSMRTYEEEGRTALRDYLEKCVSSKKLTKAEMQEMLDGIEDIYQTCKEFKDKYAPFGTWSDAAVVRDTYGKPVFSVVTPNGEYKMNLDFSLVCKKRRTLDAVFNEMSRRGIIDDFELGQKSVVKINEIIRKHGLETACALCFVDAKRFRQASMADSFTSLYNGLVESLVPDDQRSSIDRFNFGGYETIKKVADGIHTWDASKLDFSHLDEVMKSYGKRTVEYKSAKYIKTHAEGRKLLLRGDFMSSQGFDAVKTRNKSILFLYNAKKGAGGPKAAFGDVQYMNEIIQKARHWTPAKAYAVGGVRIQSFSDYVPRMVFDYVQMVYDLAATGLPAHAYTKEALFAKQFGLTGIKINMSLIPAIAEGGVAPGLDANGDYVWAGESFDYETAKEIQNAEGYTENCGTICVGVSDRHIRKLLSDPNIRMVIPYHKSGLNPIVAHMNRIAQFTDYTGVQNTLDSKGSKVSKDFDFDKALHAMGKNGDPKAVVNQYLEWCDDHGYTPKFSQFRDHPNYYKLIEDFTLFDRNNQYVPQHEVRAVFPKDGSAFGSMKDLIKAGLEEDAVIEGKRDSKLSSIVDEIQKTLPRTEAEISEDQVAQADRDLEAGVLLSARDYARQVDEVKNNTHDPLNHVYMGTTPVGIAKVLDLPKLPMLVTPQHIYSMAVSKAQAKQDGRFKSRYNYHNLGWDAVKKLPEYINKPALLIKSNTDPDDATFVVVTAQADNAGNPIIAAVKPNGRGNYFNIEFPTNIMLSGYGKDGIQGYVARAKTENRILYANKNSQKTKNTPSVQFADNILSSDYSANLAQFKGIVKSKFDGTIFENNGLPKFSDRDTEGNSLTKEQSAFFAQSKVRDADGNLMVMYHGTDNPNFTVFNPEMSDDHISLFFTSDPDVANTYTTRQDYGRDVDPYNLITEDSSAEQFNAAQKRVGGGLRVVKITSNWIQEMKAKAEKNATRLFGVANKYADLLAHNNSSGIFNYDIERIREVTGKGVENLTTDGINTLRRAMGSAKEHSFFATDHKGASREIGRIYSDTYKLFDEVRNYKTAAATPDSAIGQYTYTETNSSVPFMIGGNNLDFRGRIKPGTEREMVAKAIDRMKWVQEHNLGNRYKVYLNITNPYIIDAGIHYSGKMDRVSLERSYTGEGWRVSFENASTDEIKHMTTTDFMAFIDSAFDAETSAKIKAQIEADNEAYRQEWDDLDPDMVDHDIQLRNVYMDYTEPGNWNALNFNGGENAKTRDVAAWAKANGYDGVIFKNMKDAGGYAFVKGRGGSTVAAAFSSEQVKSVDNKNPTADPDMRYSDRDSDGNQLSEDQQEFFADSKARDENGNLYVLYHGSRSPLFTEFDMYEGVWLTPDQRYAEVYAETWHSWRGDGENLTGLEQSVYADPDYRVYKMYANITNPLDLGEINDEFDRSQMNRLARLLGVPASRIRGIAYEGGYQTVSFVYEVTKDKQFIDIAREKGYDGFIASEKGRKTFCAFNSPNQVKLTTNEVPSSFYDIRYQDRAEDSVSNRSLLANALEGVAQNQIEAQAMAEYKRVVPLLDQEERKLQKLNDQIKELSFAKGPKDTARIKELQFDARQTANRINTYDRQLLRMEASKPIQAVLDREKKMAYKRAEQKGKEALAAYREKATQTQREIINRYQESRKKGIESRNKTAMRHKIKDVVSELNQYLLRGTKDRHVPIELQRAVAEALNAVNMDTVGAEQRIAKLKEDLLKAKTPEAIQEISRKIDNIQTMGDRMNSRLQALKDAYDKFVNSDDPLIANSHDEVISAKLESVIETVGDTPLRDMTLTQLEDVYDMYRMVLTTIQNANKTFKQKKSESIAVLGNRVMMEVEKVGGKKAYRLKGTEGLESFDWNNLKPVYAFERIGSGTLTEVFNNVRTGEDVWATDVTEARDYYLGQSKKHHYDSWDFDKRYKFTSTSGMDFELSLEQIMSLYAYSKREQAAEHLKRGGIVFDETTEVTMKSKLGIPLKFNPTEATAYNISDETLADIVSKLTQEQRAFVDEMQEYLSSTMGAKGNEVSLALYGIKLFKEKFYFPLRSATQFMAKAKEQQQGEVKIKNKGFSKETAPKASNPIVLTPFMDVWAKHVNEMSMYHAFVLPMEDFYRVYNYKTPTSETMATESVEMFIQNAYGKGATKYIDQLLKDLNGGARSDPRESFTKALMSKFKKAAVMASLSVVVQQPTAIVRAMALVDAKHFGIAPITRGIVRTVNAKKHKALWNEVKQYAPVAVIKEMGHFDTNMGRSTLDFIKAKDYTGISEKAKAMFTDEGYRDEVISRPAALADELAWVAIWEAVKRETVSRHKDLRPSSEEFLKAVGERFTEVVTKTQVYDSVLSRSGNMRSKTAFMNMWTSFMAEPTTSINMLQDALLKGKRGDKRYTAKAFGAVYGSVILNAALVSLVYAMRDDDEDETFTEKYLSRVTTEILDGINPLTYIPFLKDVWSIMQGYDIERADMSLITDLVDTLQKTVKVLATDTDGMDDEDLAEHQKKVSDALWSMVDNISSLAGIPVKNVRRDINGVINLFDTLSKDAAGRETTIGSLLDKIQADVKSSTPVIGWMSGESKGDKLYDAIVSGDTAYVDRLKGSYSSESSYNTAVRKALRENDPRIHEAAVARSNGDIAGYTRLAKEIIAEGHFNQDMVVTAINAEISAMDKGETTTTSAQKASGLYKVEDFAVAISQGDTAMASAIKVDIIQTAQKNGKTAEEAEKSFVSSATTACKELFLSGEAAEAQVIDALVNFCDRTEDEALADVQYWAFKQDYPDVYADDAWFDKYYEEIADSGIEIDMYMEYRNQVKDITGEGKKERRMAVIDSLPITSAQKDALYYAEGWAESTLDEAPWH